MKFRNIMLLMASVFILSMLSDLYYNLKINELSSDLEQINNEILQLEIEKSKVYLIFQTACGRPPEGLRTAGLVSSNASDYS